ncbi:MAG TPA: hypothetical protein VKR58_12450 [Aquella sp.]|nr:hypothetical protein [Aquella sp.]
MESPVAIVYGGLELFYPGGANGYILDYHHAVNPNNDDATTQSLLQWQALH